MCRQRTGRERVFKKPRCISVISVERPQNYLFSIGKDTRNMLVVRGYDVIKHSNTTKWTFFRCKLYFLKTISLISKQQHLDLVPLPHGLPYGINFLPHILALNTRESSLQAAHRPCSFVCQPCVSLNRGQRWWRKQSGPDWTEMNPVANACHARWSSAAADCRCVCWRCWGLKCCC